MESLRSQHTTLTFDRKSCKRQARGNRILLVDTLFREAVITRKEGWKMRKQSLRKLTVARETLRRLEDLQGVLGGARAPSIESICECLTHICISEGYTGCTACNS